jgi:predicted AlkP superfamily pyrophosphatase or phosphodiesterase
MTLPDVDVNNVYIFVGDAVRFDKTEDGLVERGKNIKTVASSTHTPTSFASMFTGHRPTTHGISGFFQQLNDIRSIFDLPEHTAVYDELGSDFHEWLRRDQALFGVQDQVPLTDLEEPFVALDRDIGGHAPYPPSLEDPKEGSRYFERRGHDTSRLELDYDDAISNWLDRLDHRLQILRDRGIEEDTLVIATSDHGELLGEYGQIGHDYPAVPELVWVPTTVIHPTIEPGAVDDGVMRHIDLFPTILDALGYEQWKTLPGRNLFRNELASYGTSYYNRSINDYFRRINASVADIIPTRRYEIEAVYDDSGGFSFIQSSYPTRLLVYLFRTFVLPNGTYTRGNRKYRAAYRAITREQQRYGSPAFSSTEAEEMFDDATDGKYSQQDQIALSEDAVENLSDLGYL